MSEASLWPWELTLLEKYTPQRGWGEMLILNDKLSHHLCPTHFRWAHHYLYTLPIGDIALVQVSPSEDEKNQAWCFNKKSGSECEDRIQIRNHSGAPHGALMYNSSVQNNTSLNLQIPYISYTHFSGTKSYQNREPYLEYVKASEDHEITNAIYQEMTVDTPMKTNMKEPEKDPIEVPVLSYGISGGVSIIQGFFNGIPTDSALLYSNGAGLSYNLVSSDWADWQHFALHAVSEDFRFQQHSEGTKIKCHGYISGTWTEQDLTLSRRVYKLFVVDTVFRASAAEDSTTHLFALSTEALGLSASYRRPEKRAFCARLNPSLYCLAIIRLSRYQAVYQRKMTDSNVKSITEDESNIWAEMNRREQWDRDFERRKPTDQADRDELERALGEEDRQRALWDSRFQELESALTLEGVDSELHQMPVGDGRQVSARLSAGGSGDVMEATSKKKSRMGKALESKLRFLF
ncbi:hypothetical protein MMC17_007715 [Xylographa soralifera]|nr:hypothetical protein [Xylographa soralifera]